MSVTGIIAYGIGYLLVKNTGFGFLILTSVLGMLIVLIYGNINWLGGYQGIEAIPTPDPIPIPYVTQIEFVSKASFYYLMLGLLFFVIIAFSAFYASWAGRAWRAIGLGPNLAESIGVDLHRYRLLSFVVASMGAGLAGSFYAHYIGAVTPSTFGIFKTIHIHIYAILGGLGFPILGPIIGALIMTFVPEILRITGEIEPIFTGFLIIVLIKFLPGGVLSLFAKREGWHRPDILRAEWADQVTALVRQVEKGEVVLQVRRLTRFFGGLAAITDLDLDVLDSEILGVIGPNGAGKTTLFNVISGFLPPSRGQVILDGEDITLLKAHEIAQRGISRIFQTSTLFMSLSVLENVFTGYHLSYRSRVWKRLLRMPSALREEATFRKKAMEIIDFMGLGPLKHEIAANLPHGHQRILGICIALAAEPKLLLLDEPVTGMNQTEIQTMIDLILRIREKRGHYHDC